MVQFISMRHFHIFILLTILLLMGCISETNIPSEKKSILQLSRGFDVDNDNFLDISQYTYTTNEIGTSNEGDIIIQRSIYFYPNYFEVEPVNDYTPDVMDKFSNVYQRINDEINSQEQDCWKNFNKATCLDPISCKKSCTTKTCLDYQNYDVGLILQDFKDVVEKRNEALSNLGKSIPFINTLNSTKDVSIELTKLYVYDKIIENHPAVMLLGICKPTYSNNTFGELNRYVGKLDVKTNNALVYYNIIGVNIKQLIELNIEDDVPYAISGQITKVTISHDHEVKSSIPLIVEFKKQRLNEMTNLLLVYKITTSMKNSRNYFEMWTGGNINIRALAINSPILDNLLKFLYNSIYSSIYHITGKSYLAFGLTLIIFIYLIMFLSGLSMYVYSFFIEYGQHKNKKLAFKRAFGEADILFMKHLTYAVGLFIIALVVEVILSKDIPLNSFDVFDIKHIFEKDVFAFISLISYLLFAYYSYLVIADKIKGLIVGKDYYKNRVDYSLKSNILLLKKLDAKLNEAKLLLDRLSDTGIDVNKEMDYILSVPYDDLQSKLQSEDPGLLNQRINYYLSRVEEIISEIKKKSRIADENWAKWETYISNELESKQQVLIDTLVAIPYQWRIWAVKKYIFEHPEEGLTLNGQILEKQKLSREERLNKILKHISNHYNVLGGFYYSEGNIISMYSRIGKKSVVYSLFYRLLLDLKIHSLSDIYVEGNYYIIKTYNTQTGKFVLIVNKEDLDLVDLYLRKKSGGL